MIVNVEPLLILARRAYLYGPATVRDSAQYVLSWALFELMKETTEPPPELLPHIEALNKEPL